MKSNLNEQNYFRPAELAEYLRVGKSTIYRWIKEDLFPKPDLVLGRKCTLWRRSTIEAHLQGKCRVA